MSEEQLSLSVISSRMGDEPALPDGLGPEDFPVFFQDLHGYEAFPWQRRLADQVLKNTAWPDVIDLPTGTGKTAVLDIAVFAMAAQPDVSPRRIVFVIDRRIVVDQVYKRAQRIQRRIEKADTPVLKLVRERLRGLSDGNPLNVVALRGGVPIDNEWASRPDQPWVMVSTVDQYGSRLLFRGYGVGWRMRPVHAGLAGNDCLIILDEVHLSVPFAETLAQVSALRYDGVPRRFAVVEMSATPSNLNADPFTLDPIEDIEKCDELRRRLRAEKQADLVAIRDQDAIPTVALKLVRSIAKKKPVNRVSSLGIVLNRVRVARETYQALEEAGFSPSLLTGRMRPIDRLQVLTKIGGALDPDKKTHSDSQTILVSTQAIEVGADFSFDALITECAAVDSLRQRFGRLDRRGKGVGPDGKPARAWILGLRSVIATKRSDPVYGHSIKSTWNELKCRRDTNGRIDVGPLSLQDFPIEALAPRAQAPLLLKSHMDAWVQTKPEPIVQPSLEWHLHGIDTEHTVEPDVSIVWRWDFSREALSLVPPRQAECLAVPISAAMAWLADGRETDMADVNLVKNRDNKSVLTPEVLTHCVRWRGFGEAPQKVRPNEIGPGDVLVVKPDRGGITAGTWNPSSTTPVTDLGDQAQLVYGRRATLRLNHWLHPDSPLPKDEIDLDSPRRDRIQGFLSDHLSVSENGSSWVSQAIIKLGANFEITVVDFDDQDQHPRYYILTERKFVTRAPKVEPAMTDGSDEAGAFTGSGVSLNSHLHGVGERAMQIARRLGCAEETCEDLYLAGRLHDIGKVDRRFQDQLVGGDPVASEMLDEPLAKSLPGVRRSSRYPKGMRHEIASVAMIESNPEMLVTAHDHDLVLHLVGTHHGWGRPLPPIFEDREPQTLTYKIDRVSMSVGSNLVESSLALEMADRFWLLVRRYGYYGLAWLEAVFRLADHQQSAAEEA